MSALIVTVGTLSFMLGVAVGLYLNRNGTPKDDFYD